MGSLGRAGTERPPGRSLDPRRLKLVPARLSLWGTHDNGARRGCAGPFECNHQALFGSDGVRLFVLAGFIRVVLVISKEFGQRLGRGIGLTRCGAGLVET